MHQTPFFNFHQQHGARMVQFADWELPIMYRSIHEEHHQVRNSGGLFDVSHMGRLKISGRHARRFLERMLTRRITDAPDNSCRYTLICNQHGGVLDDAVVYRYDYHWLLIVNAANRHKILQHFQANTGDLAVKIDDLTMTTAMVAVQGPRVMEVIGKYSSEVIGLKRYRFCEKNLLVLKMTISRTGYTGEDGVEVIMGANMANMALKILIQDNADAAAAVVAPAGLGARDTLRIEAGMPLYGQELDENIDPLSAGLGFAVSLDKDQQDRGEPFIGQEALKKIAAAGIKNRLVGLELDGKRTARPGMAVLAGGKHIGNVTSGCLSPTLGLPIAMAYLDVQTLHGAGQVQVELAGKQIDARCVELPFYKRPKR